MEMSTITAFISLLYNLVSCIEDNYERRDWFGRLLKLKEKFEATVRLF